MSWVACCRKIDEQAERIENLEALKDLQFEELQTANAMNRALRAELSIVVAQRDKLQLKVNCGAGPW